MALKLVDGGIPSFEWKMKRFEIPFSDDELQKLKKRVELGELDEKKAFKKRYVMKDNPDVNIELFRKILRKLPSMPGNLVLIRNFAGKMEIIEVFKSEIDLREDFKNSKKRLNGEQLNRYSWLKKLIKENGISSVQFLIGRVA
jgi:hypothetical protein